MTAADLIGVLPSALELIETLVEKGHDPKVELKRIASSYAARARAESSVEAAAEAKRRELGER